jgi:hypothetical protein
MMGCVEFGKQLLKTEDLDPIYIIANKNTLPKNQLRRFLLAYWWFYHAGVASYLSEKEETEFFDKALTLVEGTRAPRGTERRHFRGDKAKVAIQKFMFTYGQPENAIRHLLDRKRTSKDFIDFVKKEWVMFGPWIGFKVADMVDRCLGVPIQFKPSELELYDSPKKGAWEAAQKMEELWSENQDDPAPSTQEVVEALIPKFKKYKAPPFYDRQVGVQEVETILCKWHSYRGGHYRIGKDIVEIREALNWHPTETSEKLLKLMPKEVQHK